MRILVALDESPVSARAAREAARLFSPQPDAEFLVVNVATVPVNWAGTGAYGVVGPMIIDPRWLDPAAPVEDDLERALLAEATTAGLGDAEVLVRLGDPVDQICAAAEQHDVDVIVVGSHDKSALRRLFDASVAAGVVRSTSLPVLVVGGGTSERHPAP